MPETFTVFNSANRDANVQYNSATFDVPVDTTDKKVKFTLTVLDIVNEPETTVINWTIERNDGGGWQHMAGGALRGSNGAPSPKPPGTLSTGLHNVMGQQVRGSLYFTSANDQRKRFGVDGETL